MKNSNQAVFQRRLKEILDKLELSQSELARRMKVTPQAVQRWCNGLGEPRKSALEKLAEVTGAPAHWFYTPYDHSEKSDVYTNISFGHVNELPDNRKQVLLSPDE
ncbi:XRE family transcriptional regulator, partial [Salmonella enterica subsp. enterica serovar Potsdam]|nr:XRE family transcriptional regulator [Salmonella enterica subsp. enterica serovar Potsdam]EBV2470979.1 XRE family transcriptional regulator [Salmonella enterica subsp. enterica serovar Potsdam]